MKSHMNPLGLDQESLEWRRALCQMAQLLAKATLVGNPAPMVERISKRLRHPVVGDYVYETSSFYRRKFEDGTPITAEGCGYLRKVVDEVCWTEEEWQDELKSYPAAHHPAPQRPTEDVWYVQYGPKDVDVCRWTNCSFGVVPLDEAIFEPVEAGILQSDGSVMFTRDSLVGGLAGFNLK